MSKASSSVKKTESVEVAAATPVVAGKTPKVAKVAKTSSSEPATPVKKSATAVPVSTTTETPAKKKVTKAKTVSDTATVVTVDATAVTVDAAAAAVTAVVATTEYSEFMGKLQQVSTLLSSLRGDFRLLEKKSSRELKLANKANAKRARKQKGNRSPSGFVKPTLISLELASFLGKEPGTQMARTEVTREINTYIRANSLQDKENGRKINANEKLAALLKLTKGEELTYFNLQRYMSPHFVKTVPASVVVVA